MARRDESGFATLWLAVALVAVLGCAALAVDLGFRSAVAQQAQGAADAAALGGTVFLPTDATAAAARAREIARANGVDPSDPNVSIAAAPVPGQPTRLAVTITRRLPVFFARILGQSSMTITRTAIADYDQPVQMGNPSNTFGNQPDCIGVCTTGAPSPGFWANVEGPGTAKGKGNAFMANRCDTSDNCAGANSDYAADGALFVVRNQNAGATLRVDLFDAVYAHVGDQCDDAGLATLHTAMQAFAPWLASRYQVGGWSPTAAPYCTGDVSTDDPNTALPVTTRFRLLAPDATPWTVSDNVPVPGCDLTLVGTNHLTTDFWNPGIVDRFRVWSTLCAVGGAAAGDYVLQVQTPSGTGNNNFAVRATLNGSGAAPGVSVFGLGRMAIYANSAGASMSRFHLARVLPGAAGRTLTLGFFDTGDALSGSSGTLQVLPPPDATVRGTSIARFSGCTYTPPPGTSTGPPFGTAVSTPDPVGGCSVGNVSAANYNGQWVEWKVPIPSGYSCNYADPFGCWVRIEFGFSGGVLDVTSWRASLDGNPVRLVG